MGFSKSELRNRLDNARRALGELDALLVNGDENVRYLTGVDTGRVLIWRSGARFWLNEVYLDRAKGSPVKPEAYEKDCVKKFIISKRFRRVGIDSISLKEYKATEPELRKLLKPSDICAQLRKIKSKEELKLLARAGRIAAEVTSLIDESEILGMSDFELSGLLEHEIRKRGSEKPSFGAGMLCQVGENSKYPHSPPTGRVVRDGDLVIIDLGAVCQGYNSDMTRTLRIGNVSKEKSKIADLTTWLKQEAIDRINVGGKISEVHSFINKEIEKAGYKFAHLSGHGVGLEVHEKPSVGPDEKDLFQNGMVFTIEPGIYTASFGARSEDTIALAGGKKRILTKQ
ncbi:MAG: Xaa-Pro peptidase family protein [candidate division WOR-3 bacterium]